MSESIYPELGDSQDDGMNPSDMDVSHSMGMVGMVGMDKPFLDNDAPRPLIPRVKLPTIVPTNQSLSQEAGVSDLRHGAEQSQELAVTLDVDPTGDKAVEGEGETSTLALEPSMPPKQEPSEDCRTEQRTSTESSESAKSKTYSIAELVDLGYRSRKLSRNELRLSEEAPIEHIFPGGLTERDIDEPSKFVPFQRTHRRDHSTQSLSSESDREEFAGKPVHSLRQTESLLRPRRQPRHPPDGSLLQTNAGFAHFLKQHASPPHKRVTAGGRIVPAGPNSPPPTFKMETIDAMLQGNPGNPGNPRGNWPSRYSAPPARLQDMYAPQHQPFPMHGLRANQNGMHGNPVNTIPQRAQTFPTNGTATIPQASAMPTYPGNEPVSGLRIPDGAEFVGMVDGIPVVMLNGKMGQVEWIHGTHHCHFKPFEITQSFKRPMQQVVQQPAHTMQYPIPVPHAMHGYPVHPFPAMLPPGPAPHMQNGFPGPMLPTVPGQQNQNGFAEFPGFPGMNAPMGFHPNVSTGFVPTGNGQPTGFAPIAPMSSNQVRDTPSVHIPDDKSPQGIKVQQQALNAQYDIYKKELSELERYAALHNDEFTPLQNVEITTRRRILVHQMDETRKRKLQLDKYIQCASFATVAPGPPIPPGPSGNQPSKSRQSSKTRGQAPQVPTIGDVAKIAIAKDDQQKELHRATKKFSPDAPVFVPAASAGFCGPLGQRLLEGPTTTDLVLKVESPIVLAADASYCDRLGFNNPSEPKQFCTEPAEFAKVIKSAHEQARRYGCEGGQSKDPEWDAEQDIRWAMQDELPIPLAPDSLDYVFDQQPWNWADSYFNVRKYRTANWMPPRYIQAPKQLPPVRSGRFSRQQSVNGGVPLFRTPGVEQHLASGHSSGKSSLTVTGHKHSQASYDEGGNRATIAGAHTISPQRIQTEASGGPSEEYARAHISAQLDSKLSELNLALLNGDDVSQISSKLLRPLSRQISADSSFVTNLSQEEKAKTREKIQCDAEKLYRKADQLMERYAAKLEQNPELVDAFEPLNQLARMVRQAFKGKDRSPAKDNGYTNETLETYHESLNTSSSSLFDSSNTSPQRHKGGPNATAASLVEKTNNELKAVPVAPEPKFSTKSMIKRQANQFAKNLISNKSPEQGENFSGTDKATETPRSDAQKRLLAHLNFASGDENRPFESTSMSMMYKAPSSIASPTFEAQGMVHSPGTSMEAQPPTPIGPRTKDRDHYTEYDLGLMRKAAYVYTKDWAAKEGFRNPSTTSSKQKLPGASTSEDTQEPKLTRAQRYQTRHGLGHGHKTLDW